MTQQLTYLGLNILGFMLIVNWFIRQVKEYKSLNNKLTYFSFNRFKHLLLALVIVATPLLVINFTEIAIVNHLSTSFLDKNKQLYSLFTSLFISLIWLIYILKLDVFNTEKKRNILLIFIISSIFTLFADIPYSFLYHIGFQDSTQIIPGFIYSVFGIGLIEESIKFIPLLIMLRYSKAIDEPYDYILYASVSALGFAFVENTMYLNMYGLEIISGRALYATVAHMMFSSILAYGLVINKYKLSKINPFIIFISFFFFAILSHGFYDFWLINESVTHLSGISSVFLLISIHVWFTLKNNSINISNYYNATKTINNDVLKTYLTLGLLSILMGSYLYIAFKYNRNDANQFFIQSVFVYGYLIFYIIATLTQYNLIEGVLHPIRLSIMNIIPKSKKDEY